LAAKHPDFFAYLKNVFFDLWIPDSGFWIPVPDSGFRFRILDSGSGFWFPVPESDSGFGFLGFKVAPYTMLPNAVSEFASEGIS